MKKFLALLLCSFVANAAALIDAEKPQFLSTNIVKNSGFEAGKTNWTNSGGTFAITTSSAEGKYSASFDASATSQYIQQTGIALSSGLKKNNCVVTFKYKGGDTGLALNVLDASSNVLVTKTLSAASDWVNVTENFVCPDSASVGIKILSSADAAIAYFDSFFVGDAALVNLSQVNQAELFGVITWTSANCAWSSSSTGSWLDFSADADCSSTLLGNGVEPSTKVPGIKFTSLPPGYYQIEVQGYFYVLDSSSASTTSLWRLSDGSNYTSPVAIGVRGVSGSIANKLPGFSGLLKYTTAQTNITFQVQAYNVDAASVSLEADAGTTSNSLQIKVFRYPLQSEIAYKANTVTQPAGVFWSNVSGCTFTSISDAKLTDADCNTATRTYGDVTSGNDILEMTVPNIQPGKYLVMSHGSFGGLGSSGVTSNCQFYLTDGTTIIGTSNDYVTTYDSGTGAPGGIIEYTSVQSSKTFSVYANRASATGNCSCRAADTKASCGISLVPISQSLPMPQIVNSVSSSSSGVVKLVSAYIANSGTPTITRQDGNWISSLTDSGTGYVTINVTSGIFSAAPNCSCSVVVGASQRLCGIYSISTSEIKIRTGTGNGADTDNDFSVICVGAN
jgi:hypothetical protein